MQHAMGTSLGWGLIALPAAALGLRWVGTLGPRSAIVVALAPFLGPLAWIGLAIARRRRHRLMVASAALVTVIHAVFFFAPAVAAPSHAIADVPSPGSIRLFSANVRAGSDHVADVVAEARANGADLVVLQEIEPHDAVGLPDRGIGAGYGHAILDPLPGYFGGAVLSRWPIVGSSISVGGYPMISARVSTPHGELDIVNVHVVAPLDAEHHRRWSTQLVELRTLLAGAELPLVLAGDFNATPDHVELRRVAEAGTGVGELERRSSATFPSGWPIPPLVALDHVIGSRDVSLVGSSTVDVVGSDHRGLVVDIELRRQPVARGAAVETEAAMARPAGWVSSMDPELGEGRSGERRPVQTGARPSSTMSAVVSSPARLSKSAASGRPS